MGYRHHAQSIMPLFTSFVSYIYPSLGYALNAIGVEFRYTIIKDILRGLHFSNTSVK